MKAAAITSIYHSTTRRQKAIGNMLRYMRYRRSPMENRISRASFIVMANWRFTWIPIYSRTIG
jgi:hypothetical protein